MSSPAAQFIPLFPEEEIPFILQAVLRCGKLVRKKEARELENRINDRLYLYLRRDPEIRRRPVRPFREIPVYDGTENENAGGAEAPIGRPDLIFLYPVADGEWPYLALECKRLYVKYQIGLRPLISEYVTGHQGMRCFIDERYATGLSHGAMLGYVFDGDVAKARDNVAQSIRKHYVALQAQGEGEMLPSGLQIENVLETRHLIEGKDFVIHHLFIAV